MVPPPNDPAPKTGAPAPHPRADWAPFELVIFDCDSTLSTIEGIDELARWRGRDGEVAGLTARAMNGEVPLEAVYSQRLDLLKPTRAELRRLGRLYRENLFPGADQVLEALQALDRQVFIVSGGLAEAVADFGTALGVPADHIHAVGMDYNQLSGRWWESWKHPRGRNPDEHYLAHDGGPLTVGHGKADIIRDLRALHRGRAMLVGDGSSDLEAGAAVDLFVGFGGVVAREAVQAAAPVFIHGPSLAPVLPLALARHGVPEAWSALYHDGIEMLRDGQVTFKHAPARDGLLRRLA